MNKIQRGKTALIALSIMMIVVCLAVAAACVALVVFGASLIAKESYVWGIVAVLFGSVATLGCLAGVAVFTITLITGASLKATNGSIAQENLGMGTVNMLKCPKCGNAVAEEDQVCGKCGNSLAKIVICPKCKAENKPANSKCTSCGENLK